MNLREIREYGTHVKELSARPWGMVSQGNVPEAEWQVDKPARDICPAAWTLASKAHGLLHPSKQSSVGIWAGEPTGPSWGFGSLNKAQGEDWAVGDDVYWDESYKSSL